MKKKKLVAACCGVYVAAAIGMCAWGQGAVIPDKTGIPGNVGQEETDPNVGTAPGDDPYSAVAERVYTIVENNLVYGAAGQADRYVVSEDVLLTEDDKVSMLQTYAMPSLKRMNAEDAAEYMDGIQVLARIEALGLNPDLFFTPEYDWKAIYNDSLTRVKEAVVFAQTVEFEGSTASELNGFLQKCSRVTVNISSEAIVLDETIVVPSDVVLQGNGVRLSGAGQDSQVDYALLCENVENVGIYGFRLLGGFGQGIYIIGSHNCLIWGNEIADATYKALCVMADNSYVNLVNNSVHDNGNGAIFLNGDISNCIIQGNEVYQNRGTRNLTAGIVFSSMEVEDPYTPYNVFKDEHLYNLLKTPHQNVVKDNHIQGNYSSGFYCDGGYLNYVLDNLIEDNEKEGMCLDYGTFGTYVTGNTIRRNGDRNRQTDEDLEADFILGAGRLADGSSTAKLPGISIDNSAYNILFENVVSDNSGSGVKMVRSGYRNLILCNVISDNNRGRNEAFHGFGIEFGHASDPDEPVIGLDFTADFENIAARNMISGAHYAGIFFAEGSYCNDLIDNVVMDSQFFSIENHSRLYNGSVGNTVNVDVLDYGLNQ